MAIVFKGMVSGKTFEGLLCATFKEMPLCISIKVAVMLPLCRHILVEPFLVYLRIAIDMFAN